MAGEKAINETIKTQSLLSNCLVFTVSLVLNGVVITQSLLHVGELCEGTTGGNEGRAGPVEWGKRWRHALQWWGMGWLGWALWQAGGRCGRDILHEIIYR